MFSLDLQRMAWWSSTGAATALRMAGLVLLLAGLRLKSHRVLGLAGVALVVWSFTVTGHTSVAGSHWLLMPLLALHLLVACFWFGALLPLYWVVQREAPAEASRIVVELSHRATVLVPLLAVAGLAMALLLLPNADALLEPYGLLLLGKLLGFCLLLLLAGLNKWRLAPALVHGGGAVRAFSYSVLAEYVVVVAVLCVTAVMTGLFSPDM
ncbi:MAG: CopD family protein [Polyangiaceae bacterium]